jgi:hypothetical protein
MPMYEKRLNKGQVRVYMYAPPLTGLDEISDDRLPDPPYAGVPREERSVYYYWWAFLRENADYWACCEAGGGGPFGNLYADFGDVRPTDFFSWWRKRGRDLFCEEPRKAVTVHQVIPAQHDFEKELLVSVPITCDTAQSLRELQLMLRNVLAKQDSAKEDCVQTYSTARYPVHSRPVIKSLHQALTIWRLRKKYQDEGVRRPLYLLADDAKLPISIQNRENDTATKNIKSVTASKTLAKAEALIKNVAMGRFPDDR